MKLTFECLDNGRWYVVMPDYQGPHDDLEMVENADKMVDFGSSRLYSPQ